MNSNKTKTYSLYAVGEILLVVIGILIALQINNWNEDRIKEFRARGYAEALLAEVEENLSLIDERRTDYLREIDWTRRFMDQVNNSKSHLLTNDSLVLMTRYMGPVPLITLSKSTYDDLISSGSLEMFDDATIREKVMAMGRRFEVIDNSMERSDRFWEYLSAYYVKHADLTSVMNRMIDRDYGHSYFELDRTAFVRNREFTNMLAMRLFRLDRAERAGGRLVVTLEELKAELQRMLD